MLVTQLLTSAERMLTRRLITTGVREAHTVERVERVFCIIIILKGRSFVEM